MHDWRNEKKKDQDQPILNLLLAAISVMLPDIEMANVNKGRALYIYFDISAFMNILTCNYYFNMGLHAISVTSDFRSNYKKTTAQCFHLCPQCLSGTQIQSNSYIYFAINRRTHLFLHVLFTKLRLVSWATKLKNTSLTIILDYLLIYL